MNLREAGPRAVILLLLVFGAGVAGGVALERLWLDTPTAAAAGASREDDGEKRERTVIERFSDELELTAGQEARIDTILKHYRARMHEMWKEVRPRYRALVDSVRSEIEGELTEKQVRQYRKLLERQADRRDDRDEKGRDGDDPEGEAR